MALALVLLAGCAHRPADDPADPLEPVNRAVFTFNEKADKYLLRPIAVGYNYVVPDPVQHSISNFFDNLDEPRNFINDLLQLKFKQSAINLSRLVVNSTAGIAGFFDVADRIGLHPHQEDFGQTLGYWGVGEGWFLMLPFLGPSTNRDLVGYVGDMPTKPTFWLPGRYDVYKYSAQGVQLINYRASLLTADRILDQQFDKYLFIRTAYLQQRQNKIYDGNPPQEAFELPDDEPAPAKGGK